MVPASNCAVYRRDEDDVCPKGRCLQRRGGEGTVALNMGKVAPDRRHETESLGVVRDEHEHVAGMGVGGEVHEAASKNVELLIGREQSVKVLQSLAKRRFVRWQDAVKDRRRNR